MAKPETFETEEDEITFNLLNEETMEWLLMEGTVNLPEKKIKIPEDMRWNLKTFNSELIRGLENGESMRDIANRIFPEIMSRVDLTGKTVDEVASIIKKNKQSAIRNARTMVTNAENLGRLDSYKNLNEQGVVQQKIWMSTPDDRTRPTHIDMDGEEQDIDAIFSNGCMFPADSNGPAEEVWQCRCSMRDKIVGFRRADGGISYVSGDRGRTMHDDQMGLEKERRDTNRAKSSKNTGLFKSGAAESAYTAGQQRAIEALVNGNSSISKELYLKFHDKLQPPIDPEGDSSAYFDRSDRRVHFKTEPVANPKSSWRVPYGVHFHEYGHNIDYLAGKNGTTLSLTWRDAEGRTFYEIIKNEWYSKFMEKATVKNFKANWGENGTGPNVWFRMSLRDWRGRNDISRDDPRNVALMEACENVKTLREGMKLIKDNISVFGNEGYDREVDKNMIKEYIKTISNKYSERQSSDISDMFELYSVKHGGPAYPFGTGHGKDYTNTLTTAKETFAEIFSAEISNPESLETIKAELPETYAAFREMIQSILED